MQAGPCPLVCNHRRLNQHDHLIITQAPQMLTAVSWNVPRRPCSNLINFVHQKITIYGAIQHFFKLLLPFLLYDENSLQNLETGTLLL